MRRILLFAPALLCACSTAPAEPPIHGDDGYLCRNDGLDRFVGQAATAELGAQMLAVSGARTIRWVPFGAMITMEFNPSRLTVRLDRQNKVASATCG